MNSETLIETTKGSIKIVQFNKPHRKNAIDRKMYVRLTSILNDAATNNDISMIVLTGTGDFYSSGNDRSAEKELSIQLLNVIEELIDAFIRFPKLIISIVNGPAVGIAVTTLALCDFVYASENAYFYVPFTKLGIVPEGCSTYTFPNLIGQRNAMELLLLNKKMSAMDALKCGLVNKVWKFEELHSKTWEQIEEISNIPLHCGVRTKYLFRKLHLDKLLEANKLEMKELRIIFNEFNKSKL